MVAKLSFVDFKRISFSMHDTCMIYGRLLKHCLKENYCDSHILNLGMVTSHTAINLKRQLPHDN